MAPPIDHHEPSQVDIYYRLGEIKASSEAVSAAVARNAEAVIAQNHRLEVLEEKLFAALSSHRQTTDADLHNLNARLDIMEKTIARAKTWLSATAATVTVMTPLITYWLNKTGILMP